MNNLQETQDQANKVTKRQVAIIREMAEGKSTRQIAEALGVTVNTIEVQRHDIIKRTGCKNAVHVVATFLRSGVIA